MSSDQKRHTGSQSDDDTKEAKVFLQPLPHIIDYVHKIQLPGKIVTERLTKTFSLLIS